MDEDAERTSIFSSAVTFTAVALALYLLVVWDPIGIYGHVRQYLEHSIHAPLEWVAILFALSWIIQRGDYQPVALLLLPLFILILTISSHDSGAWFWKLFEHEIFLPPVYLPRGFLLYFFILCFVLIITSQLGGTSWQGKKRNVTLLAGLFITFLLTGSDVLFTVPSPHTAVHNTDIRAGNAYGDGFWHTVRTWWDALDRFIDHQVPYDYRNAVKTVVSLYPFVAIVLLLFPGYRRGLPKAILEDTRELFPGLLVLGAIFGLSGWALYASNSSSLSGVILGIIGIPAALFLAVLGITSIFWVPMALFALPALVFVFVSSAISSPLRLASFITFTALKVPFNIWHYIHYLFVPHPAETAYKSGIHNQVPLPQLAQTVADVMYKYDLKGYERLPQEWRSKNCQKRIEAFHRRIKAEDDFMQELVRHIRLKDQFHE